mgnify:CR=1 FL=1
MTDTLKREYDPVERPAHYNAGGIECIDYIKQVLGLDGFIAYCHGNNILSSYNNAHEDDIYDLITDIMYDVDDVEINNLLVKERQ